MLFPNKYLIYAYLWIARILKHRKYKLTDLKFWWAFQCLAKFCISNEIIQINKNFMKKKYHESKKPIKTDFNHTSKFDKTTYDANTQKMCTKIYMVPSLVILSVEWNSM